MNLRETVETSGNSDFTIWMEYIPNILTEEQTGLLDQYVNGENHSKKPEVAQVSDSSSNADVSVDPVPHQYVQLNPIIEGIPYIGTYINNTTSNEHKAPLDVNMDATPSCSSAYGHSRKSIDEGDKMH
ncbi:hypothetical protein DdX_15834 [Ditylenchus destructor]|uniref:Uncharacterized protein n=1 Tax=Ditylenchus destructor TaxID=166010 RepID=A0AAD4MNW8_9BILA|nr:hypothetical protein DdX_15834 [Ditylenchus destructor]